MDAIAVEQTDEASARTPRVAATLSALVLCVVAATALPLWFSPLPASDDFLNHLARCYVILKQGSDPLLDRFYAINWIVVPNLAFDLIVPPLASLFGIFLAGKLFAILNLTLLVLGPHAVHYALYGRLSVGPLIAALFVYNKIHKFGNGNYEFSVGLATLALAIWIASARATPVVRGMISSVCIVVLFFAHGMGVVLYGIAIASVELERLWSRRSVAGAAVMVLPFCVAVLLLQLGPQPDETVLPMRWGGLEARVQALRSTFFAYFWKVDLIALAAMAAGLAALLWHRILVIPRCLTTFAVLGLLLFLVIPNEAMGAWGAAVRLPIGLLFVAVGMLRWDFQTQQRRLAFVAVLALIATLRGTATAYAYQDYAQLFQEVRNSTALVAPGSRVLVAREWNNQVSSLSAIQSLPCLVIIERSSLESLAFSHPMQQVLKVRSPYRNSVGGLNDDPIPLSELLHPPAAAPREGFFFAPTGRVYWKDWQHFYDYVYVLDRVERTNPSRERLEALYIGSRFQLFKVLR